jgi:NAD(P)-dependent dehydrogenase (short-subunit alcohol dehydrogenase family)
MTMTCSFPVSADEFKGKRVLVTGGTKGMGQAMPARRRPRDRHPARASRGLTNSRRARRDQQHDR